jgi:hypothetical protein
VHYKVLDEATWLLLYDKYQGTDLPRLSIALQTSSGVADHIVEINLRKFKLVSMPLVRYFQAIRQQKLVYISRTATVREL